MFLRSFVPVTLRCYVVTRVWVIALREAEVRDLDLKMASVG